MSKPDQPTPPEHGQFLVYATDDGRVKLDVRLQGETAWLTQAQMAALFQTTVPNVNMHLGNIFAEGELHSASVIQEFLITAGDGKKYRTKHYNLDAIISVGYRVKSAVATRFRIWATQKLREYIVKGFVLNDERLKNPQQPFDYFDELLRRIQDIRTSERRFYQKITDMKDWLVKLHAFLTINDRSILTHAGKISHQLARERAEAEYEKFQQNRIRQSDASGGDFEKAIKQLPPLKRKTGGKK